MFWILVVLAVIGLLFYQFAIRPYKYWSERGVIQSSNSLPIFGDSFPLVTRKESFAQYTQKVYNISKNARYAGFYQFSKPTLVIRDPELIKKIAVKDFDHFVNHRRLLPDDVDPLWSKNLFASRDENWRKMRPTLSPAFTSSKMKFLFEIIRQDAQRFVQYFLQQDKNTICLEMKDIFTRFTNDVIASSAFGVEINSLKEPNNEFYLMGKEITNFEGFFKNMKVFAFLLFPSFCKFLKLRLFSKKVADFFTDLAKQNMAQRESKNITRPDMVQILMEAKKSGFKHDSNEESEEIGFATVKESISTHQKQRITDDDIVAQMFGFFFAGFDSVATLMSFMSYELAINPDIQAKLISEIDETYEKCNGIVTYDTILGMKYLDMVVSESLRKWPSAVVVDRECNKPYIIQPKTPEEKPVYLEPGSVVWLPFISLHRDPQHYPDPERFDPERFSDENKSKITPYTYLPFGVGPRSCMGSRFALLETKVLFFYLLKSFEIVPNEKTQIPIKISTKSFNMNAEDGFWLDLKRRK